MKSNLDGLGSLAASLHHKPSAWQHCLARSMIAGKKSFGGQPFIGYT
jgi:hypothetical protein